MSEQTVLAGRTPDNKLYLVSSNEWNAPQTELAYKWFIEKLITYDDQNTPDMTVKTSRNILHKKMIKNELLLADLGIVDFDVDEHGVNIYHQLNYDHGNNYSFILRLENESKGTQRFLARIGPWIDALEKGGVLFVDEIEASMHPMLTRRLVDMMQNPGINTNHAQLIFTTHDVMLLDLTLLRRDQIWFTDKDPKTLVSELFSLWDFSVRKDENIRKGYLQGRYGAIPFIGGDKTWR